MTHRVQAVVIGAGPTGASAAAGDVRLDEALGDGFAIVSRGHDGTAAYDRATRDFFDAIGTRTVHIGRDADLDGTLTALLDRARAGALLIRPDRVVAASADRADLRRWRHLLESAGLGHTISS